MAKAIETGPEALSGDRLQSLGADARRIIDQGTAAVLGDAPPTAAREALACRESTRASLATLDEELAAAGVDYRVGRAIDALRQTVENGATIAECGFQASPRRGEPSAT